MEKGPNDAKRRVVWVPGEFFPSVFFVFLILINASLSIYIFRLRSTRRGEGWKAATTDKGRNGAFGVAKRVVSAPGEFSFWFSTCF